MLYMCAKFHSFIIKGTIIPLIYWTISVRGLFILVSENTVGFSYEHIEILRRKEWRGEISETEPVLLIKLSLRTVSFNGCKFGLAGSLLISKVLRRFGKGHSKLIKFKLTRTSSHWLTKLLCPWGGGTPLYRVYRYVRPQRVWFLGCFGHK